MTWVHPPFALFCLVETAEETINKILEKAWGNTTVDYFWLATHNYSDAPVKTPSISHEGTSAPINKSYNYSDFIGKKVEDVAEWLKEKPDSVDLDAHHFVILDRRAEKDGTVVVCRIGDDSLEGDKLDYIRFPAELASLHLGGMEYGTWEDFNGDGGGTAKIEY